ncbi:MAG: hypothetical protein AAF203_02360, partial [Pseudomonadota bacterium]
MALFRSKTLKFVHFLVVMTAIVTACVRNGSKDVPANEPEVTLSEKTSLSDSQLSGEETIRIQYDNELPAFLLKKEYSLVVSEVSRLQITRGPVDNTLCSAEGPFIFSFKLVDREGEEQLLNANSKPYTITPGEYVFRVELENGSLCKNIDFSFELLMTEAKNLVQTDNLDTGYYCESVEKNNSPLKKRAAFLHSLPMNVRLVNEKNGNIRQVFGDGHLCGKEMNDMT